MSPGNPQNSDQSLNRKGHGYLGCHKACVTASQRTKAWQSLPVLQVALLLTHACIERGERAPEQGVSSVALTCLDPTFVTLSGCVVSSYQLSINHPNTHFNSEYGKAHLFADRSRTCKLTECTVPCLLIIILKICAVTNEMI